MGQSNGPLHAIFQVAATRQEATTMTRINAIRNAASSVNWGKNLAGDFQAYVFAAVLIICSVTVGCSGDKPKPVTSNNQAPITQPQPQPMPASGAQAETKPAPKKPVVHRKPATVNYADKTYGVTFEYPRRYAIETGDAASQLVMSNPIPMNFVQPGGVALAAVELPETNYLNTDFSSAFFNVSVNKTVTADQCSEFAIPQPKTDVARAPSPVETQSSSSQPSTELAKTESKQEPTPVSASNSSDKNATNDSRSKLLIGDMELRATEAVSGEGTRQSDSKYFHIYQNGACYEFALNVTTNASEEGLVKHVDRDKIFTRLEQILSTVKINPVTPEVTAENPTPAAQETPAQ
jgi:hypothetical protein